MRWSFPKARLSKKAGAAVGFNRSLLLNAGSMMATALVTSMLGVAFWWVATHYFTQSAVGVASASTSAMTLLGFIATAGLGTLLMGDLPRRAGRHRSLINAALAVTASIGTVLGLCFALIAPIVSSNLAPLAANLPSVAFFAAGVGLTALAFVLDQALIGLLRGGLQLSRNIVFALVKLAALIPIALVVANAGAQWIYSAWAAGIAVSLLSLVRFYTRRGKDTLRPNFALLKEMKTSALAHHVFNLAAKTPDLAVPILVVVFVSASANASFYIAWMIAGFIFTVPWSLSTVVYAIGSGDPARLAERFRFTVAVSLAFGLLANFVLLFAASPLLQIFGRDYSSQATAPLHILALGVFGDTFRMHFIAVHRVENRLGPAQPIIWGGTALELAAAAVGAHLGGLSGVAIGWVTAVSIEGLVMGKDVLRAMRPNEIEPVPASDEELKAEATSSLEAAPFEFH